MKKKKFIIISFIIILLLVISGVVALIYINNKDDEKSSKKSSSLTKDLEWGEVYLKLINDEESFEDIDDSKLQLADLNNDKIPECVIMGSKSGVGYIAKVYSIGKNKRAEMLKELNMTDEFKLSYMYDIQEEKYDWYAVSEKDDSVYTLNLEPEESTVFSKIDKKENYIEVETKNTSVDFDSSLDKKEIEELFNETKENYIDNEEILTEEVKEVVEKKIESQKALANIKKINNQKAIVFSGDKYLYEYEFDNRRKTIKFISISFYKYRHY